MNRSEGGFTLMELLMAVTILGIIVSALAGGLIAYMRVSGETADRLGETPQIQLATTYFASDVQSAERVDVDTCGDISGAIRLVSFSWTDPHIGTKADVPTKVSYYSVPPSPGRPQVQIRRLLCEGDDTVGTTLVNAGNPGIPPTIERVECDNTRCERPRQVKLSFDLCTARASGECRDDSIPVTLTGVRRVSSS